MACSSNASIVIALRYNMIERNGKLTQKHTYVDFMICEFQRNNSIDLEIVVINQDG